MASKRRFTVTSVLFSAALLLAAGSARAGVPAPDHVIYGLPLDGGSVVETGTVTVVLDGASSPAASYTIGSDPTLGPLYVLRIPMQDPGDPDSGGAVPGQGATLYLNGQPAGTLTIGSPGTTQLVDADTQSSRAAPGLSVDDAAVWEGDSGQVQAVFTLRLQRPTTSEVRVEWVTRDRTAVGGFACGAGVDYVAVSGVAVIPPGDSSTSVSVFVCSDADPEPDETFVVDLSSPQNAVLVDPQGLGSIRDDDTPPAIAVDDTSVVEPRSGSVTATFTISLDHPWDQDVTVDWATADGSAVGGNDYTPAAGTVLIPAGSLTATVTVDVLADAEDETNEQFFLELSNPSTGTLADAEGACVIVDAAMVLRYVQVRAEGEAGVTGLDGAFSVAVSPDGRSVYATGHSLDTLLVFRRDPATGLLTFDTSYGPDSFPQADGSPFVGLGAPEDVLVAPDGGVVYVAASGDDAVAAFTRVNDPSDPDFGRLSPLEVERDGQDDPGDSGAQVDGLAGATALAVSPDGANLYVAGARDAAIAVFSVDQATGALSFEEAEIDGEADAGDLGGTVAGLAGISDVAVSPDGMSVYASGWSEGTVAVFHRDTSAANGSLGHISFQQVVEDDAGGATTLRQAAAVAVSPDGSHVYVASWADDGIQVLARAADGTLTPVAAATGIPTMAAPSALAVSRDGAFVYVASWSQAALTVLARDTDPASPGFGGLAWVEARENGVGGVRGLWGPVDLAVSPEDDTVYAAGYLDNAVSVFSRDLAAPTGLSVTSTSHTEGGWSSLDTITMQWSGADDGTVGSGVAGYSYLFDQQPDTVPDTLLEMAHGTDPHTAVSPPLADGTWYFHIRVCDFSGNCSDPVHTGPYLIDTTAPAGPSDLASPTHQIGVSSNVFEIGMAWSPAVDAGSGLGGYAAVFDQNPGPVCSGIVNLAPTLTSVTSGTLAAGHWYFHICAVDAVGNWAPALTIGPYILGTDDTPPWVGSLSSIAPPADDDIAPGEAVDRAVTGLLLRFSEAMADPPGDDTPGDVTNPSSYRLVFAGPDGVVQSTDCSTVAGDDVAFGIQAVAYDPASLTADLVVGGPVGMPKGQWSVMACASSGLADLVGNPLDGNGDGTPGDDFVRSFEITRSNLLRDPNLDSDLDGWALSDPALAAWDADDAHGEPFSGSLRLGRGAGQDRSVAASQCLELPSLAGWPFTLSGLVRLAEGVGGGGLTTADLSVLFYSQEDCAGDPIGGELVSNEVTGDSGGAWQALELQGASVPTIGLSALVSAQVEIPDGSDLAFTAWFDDLAFQLEVPGPLLVSIGDAAVVEGDAGTAELHFPVGLSRESTQVVSVDWATAAGTATAGVDYAPASGTVTFAPGTTATNVAVTVYGDTAHEADETVEVHLSNPVNADIGNGVGEGTIVDDDAPPVVAGGAASVCESLGQVAVPFRLDRRSGLPVTVAWSTGPDTATTPQDFPAATGVLVIPPGSLEAAAVVSVTDDTAVEVDERFHLRITSVEDGLAGGDAAVTILDDDPSGRAGDANHDCLWNALDLQELVRTLTDGGRTYQPGGNPDCDGSGDTGVPDILCLLAVIYGGA